VLLLLTGGGVTVGIASSRGYNFNTAMPDWMLELKGRSSDTSAANGALLELARRLNARELDAGRAQRLVAEGLEYQANAVAPWLPGGGDVIEAAHANGLVTEEQWTSYARHAFPIATLVWPDAAGCGIGVDIGPTRLGSSFSAFDGSYELLTLSTVHETPIRRGRGSTSARMLGTGKGKILMQQIQIEFPTSGRVQLHAKWHVIAAGRDGTVVAEWDEEPPDVEVIRGRG